MDKNVWNFHRYWELNIYLYKKCWLHRKDIIYIFWEAHLWHLVRIWGSVLFHARTIFICLYNSCWEYRQMAWQIIIRSFYTFKFCDELAKCIYSQRSSILFWSVTRSVQFPTVSFQRLSGIVDTHHSKIYCKSAIII